MYKGYGLSKGHTAQQVIHHGQMHQSYQQGVVDGLQDWLDKCTYRPCQGCSKITAMQLRLLLMRLRIRMSLRMRKMLQAQHWYMLTLDVCTCCSFLASLRLMLISVLDFIGTGVCGSLWCAFACMQLSTCISTQVGRHRNNRGFSIDSRCIQIAVKGLPKLSCCP